MGRKEQGRLSALAIITLALLGCEPQPLGLDELVGTWSAEFSHPPLTQVVYGTIVFDSVAPLPGGEVRLVGSFQLDSAREKRDKEDLVVALFGGPDGCLEPPGPVMGFKSSNATLDIAFTPGAADCGLVGQVSAATLTGRWQEPSFTGTRAQGELRLMRRRT